MPSFESLVPAYQPSQGGPVTEARGEGEWGRGGRRPLRIVPQPFSASAFPPRKNTTIKLNGWVVSSKIGTAIWEPAGSLKPSTGTPPPAFFIGLHDRKSSSSFFSSTPSTNVKVMDFKMGSMERKGGQPVACFQLAASLALRLDTPPLQGGGACCFERSRRQLCPPAGFWLFLGVSFGEKIPECPLIG